MGMRDTFSPLLQGQTRTLYVIVFIGLCSLSQSSFSQTESAEIDLPEQVIEEVVVTGTHIKRRDFNTTSPLATVDSQVIAFSGQPTLEERALRLLIEAVGQSSRRAVATELGYKSTSSIGRYLWGDRDIGEALAQRIVANLGETSHRTKRAA